MIGGFWFRERYRVGEVYATLCRGGNAWRLIMIIVHMPTKFLLRVCYEMKCMNLILG